MASGGVRGLNTFNSTGRAKRIHENMMVGSPRPQNTLEWFVLCYGGRVHVGCHFRTIPFNINMFIYNSSLIKEESGKRQIF